MGITARMEHTEKEDDLEKFEGEWKGKTWGSWMEIGRRHFQKMAKT